jgi:hypothetical protein
MKDKNTGRKIKESITYPAAGTFEAIHAAEAWLKEQGYRIGSMCGDEPIAFADANKIEYIAKWRNIDREDYGKMDGIIVPGIMGNGDFREGTVTVIFFEKVV